jgi:pilus assembly protein Flp/PilA
MKNLYLGFQHFLNEEEGVTAIEYGLIASLIAVVIIAAVTATGNGVCKAFAAVAAALSADNAVTCTS